jgi:hypothetical protein
MTQEEVLAHLIDAPERVGTVYTVAGSFASNFHGVPRMTQDADLVVAASQDQVVRLVRELETEFYVSEDAAREAVRLERQFNAIHLLTGFKVDLVIKKQRPFSDEELRRRIQGTLAGRAVQFATAEDTILTKLEWAKAGESARQYHDAQGILRVQASRLDTLYLARWADDLGVRDLLDRAGRGEPFS